MDKTKTRSKSIPLDTESPQDFIRNKKTTHGKTRWITTKSFGGDMETNKRVGTRRFSTFNPNGLKSHNANDTIKISIELGIDLLCYSEITMDTSQYRIRQKLIDNLRKIDKKAKTVWNSSTKTATNEYKAGGSSICALAIWQEEE